jgi:hypothetical protein
MLAPLAHLLQVHALQRMEEENAWVRRPMLLGQEPWHMTLARACWVSFFLLLPLARKALPKAGIPRSLFQAIMSNTTPYNKLHWVVRAAPLVLAAVVGSALSVVVWFVRAMVGLTTY